MHFGRITLPHDFPFRPPSFEMCGPSGSFEPNKRSCIAISDFLPEKRNQSYNLQSIFVALHSFMNEDGTGVGSINQPDAVKRKLAAESEACTTSNATFQRIQTQYRLDDNVKTTLWFSERYTPDLLSTKYHMFAFRRHGQHR